MPETIHLSLLSHTNVGKTTLARTLLREDIGEVRDRPHVTEFAESHVLIESEAGDSLVLWDTPGFGDSARLLRRLKRSENPVGWFLAQVWDRFTDRPFWCSQEAMRNARDTSDVVLYIANAGEDPASAGYIDIEMQILGWLNKPILLLLNQLGVPGDEATTREDVRRWQEHVAAYPWVRTVLPFDAFARCWIQENTLLVHVEQALPPEQRPAFERLRAAWRERNLAVFDQAMEVLARQLAAVAVDDERLSERTMQDKARAWLGSLAGGMEQGDADLERAQRSLLTRLDAQVRTATEQLVQLHGLTGKATQEVLQRIGREFAIERPADADKVGIIGGFVSGALGGVAADLAAGGLTFGAGALIGGILGAFGARGITKAYNFARGAETGGVRWSPEFLHDRVAAALVRYLAVAHFGRGRGEFVAGTAPEHWQHAIAQTLESLRDQFDFVWSRAREGEPPELLVSGLVPLVTQAAQDVLTRLYPDSAAVFD